MVANLPYIPKQDYENLEPTVKRFEPPHALVGGKTGFELYERILPQALKVLYSKGWIAFEIDYRQGKHATKLMQNYGFINVEILKDLASKDRVVVGQNRKKSWSKLISSFLIFD